MSLSDRGFQRVAAHPWVVALGGAETLLQLTRFVVIGVSNVVVGFALFNAVLWLPWDLPLKAGLAQCVAYLIGMWWSFFWNRRWTFRTSVGSSARGQALRFFVVQVTLMVVSASLIALAADVFGFHPQLSWLVVMAFITVANFVLSKIWAFR